MQVSDKGRRKSAHWDRNDYIILKDFVRISGIPYAESVAFTSLSDITVTEGEIVTVDAGTGTRINPKKFYIYGDLALSDTIVTAGGLECDTEDTGSFVIGRLEPDDYTLSASKDGQKIPSIPITIVDANVEQDLTPEPVTISGTISGDIDDGVTVSLTDSDDTVTSGGGNYSFAPVLDGSRIITPSLVGYAFTPEQRNITVARDHISNLDFTSISLGYTFLNRRQVTIDKTLVGGSLTNYPVLIYITGINTAHMRSDGADVVIFDEDDSTRLPLEIEHYDNSTGTLWMWTKVPSLGTSANHVLNVYYNCSTYIQPAVDNEYGQYAVWDSNFILVCHMSDNPTTSYVKDSTSNAQIGTKRADGHPAEEAGQIYKRQLFTAATSDYISFPINAVMQGGAVSLSCWQTNSAANQGIIDRTRGTGYALFADGSRRMKFQGIDSVGANIALYSNSSYVGGFVGAVYGGGSAQIYVSGAPVAQTVTSAGNGTLANASVVTMLGKMNDGYPLLGYIEEVHISNTVRSNAWILTEYNNQNAPGTFASVGSETSDTKVGVLP